MIDKLYVISDTISFKTFKLLQKRLVEKGSIEIVGFDKIIWEMIRDKKIYCWFEKDKEMGIGVSIPEAKETYTIKDI